MRKTERISFVGASLSAVSIAALCALSSFSSSRAVSQEEALHDATAHDATAHDESAPHTSSTRNASGEKKGAREQWLDYLWAAADAAYHKGDYPLAVQKFRAIVVLAPTDTEAFSTGAWLMWSLGNGDEATEFVRRGVQLNANDGDAWETAADHFDMRKVYAQETLRDYRKALELAPKTKDTRLLRHRVGIAAQIANQLELATQVWTEIVKNYPNDAVATYKLKQLRDGKPVPAPRLETATSSTRNDAPSTS